jgi:glycosyltransferase involved in cell wall biosynthesis
MIYDFDDALWLTDVQSESVLIRFIKWRSKVRSICQWSYKVSCGNEFLCSYARQFNQRVVYNPTTIDTDALHVPPHTKWQSGKLITVGWTGSNSTLKYLKSLEPVLADLEKRCGSVQFMVIADKPPALSLSRLIFKAWNRDTEIADLSQFDIGIMPLPDDDWTRGKCGFKALQYMALEIPAVASPVGVNPSVIDQGVNGFLPSSHEDWETQLLLLIENEDLRADFGRNGRRKVVDQYSVRSNAGRFLSLFT